MLDKGDRANVSALKKHTVKPEGHHLRSRDLFPAIGSGRVMTNYSNEPSPVRNCAWGNCESDLMQEKT